MTTFSSCCNRSSSHHQTYFIPRRKSYRIFQKLNYRVLDAIIEDPEHDRPIKGFWKQIMAARLHLTMELLRNGTHLLVTDVDNVFSRYVPLYGFLDEGYDVFHAYEMRYPTYIFDEMGFVVCSGHQFLRSSPGTLRFMELMENRCKGDKCDDQVVYNEVFWRELNIEWDGNGPTHEGALRLTGNNAENDGLLVESATGRSRTTNHTIKIWDRDFAWRLAGGIPEMCPSCEYETVLFVFLAAKYILIRLPSLFACSEQLGGNAYKSRT